MKRILSVVVFFNLLLARSLLCMETTVVTITDSSVSSETKQAALAQPRALERTVSVLTAHDDQQNLTADLVAALPADSTGKTVVQPQSNGSSMEYTDGLNGSLRFINTPRAVSPGISIYRAPLSLADFLLLPLEDSYSQQLAHLATYCHLESTESCQAVAAATGYLLACITKVAAPQNKQTAQQPAELFKQTTQDLQAARSYCAACGQLWNSPAPQELIDAIGRLIDKLNSDTVKQGGADHERAIILPNNKEDTMASARTIAQALLGFLKEYVSLKKSGSAESKQAHERFTEQLLADTNDAPSIYPELEELILGIDEQFPYLLNFEDLGVADLQKEPLMLHLFEQRIIRATVACKKRDDCPFTVLLKLLAQKTVLLEFYKQEEISNKHTNAQKSSSASHDNNNNEQSHEEQFSDQTKSKSAQLNWEVPLLVRRIEPLALTEETEIRIFLAYFGHPCEEYIIALLRKRFEHQVARAVSEGAAFPLLNDGPLIAQRMLTICSELNCVLQKLEQTYDETRTPFLQKRDLTAKAFRTLLENDPQLMPGLLNRIPVILATRELFHLPLLCLLVEQYSQKDTWGHELWRALIFKAAATMSAIQDASDQDFIESVDPEELARIAHDQESMRALKHHFQQQKERNVTALKKELEKNSHAVVALTVKEPKLVDSTALLVKELHHNKQVLLLLAKNMIEGGIEKSTISDRRLVVAELTSLGDAIRGTEELQESYTSQQMLIQKRAEYAKTKAEAQAWLTELRARCTKKEKKYMAMKGSLDSIVEDRKQLAQHYETIKTLAIQADEETAQNTVPIPELLQVCAGKFKKLRNYALTVYDWEKDVDSRALAFLFHQSLLAYEAKIEQLRVLVQKVESTCGYLEEQEAVCLQSLEQAVEKRKQRPRDLQDIGGALHALAKQFPGLVSPTVQALYPDPSSLWASWWSYVPGSGCTIA